MNINDFHRGWFVGNFEPSVLTGNFEVGVQEYFAGQTHEPHYHQQTTEVNLILDGEVEFFVKPYNDMSLDEYSRYVLKRGDIIKILPYEITHILCRTNARILCVKDKSTGTIDKISI